MSSGWQHRYMVILLGFFALFICMMDRVNVMVAIIPIADDLRWDLRTQSDGQSSSDRGPWFFRWPRALLC
ncbi:MAG: hypothetical protein OXC69_04655 [Candidatus Tectomicrobia bacterium]|nr:hypothetical protein [Candidatus Tectomicrobia bacterium]